MMKILSCRGFCLFSSAALASVLVLASSVFAADAPRWSRPKTNGNIVTAQHNAAYNDSGTIVQAQNQQPIPPAIPGPAIKPMTDAQRDTMFKELRPQSITPPAGATNTPGGFNTPGAFPVIKDDPVPAPESKSLVNQKRDTYISNPDADKSAVEKVVNPQAVQDNTKSETVKAPLPVPKSGLDSIPDSQKVPMPSSSYYDYTVVKSKEIECPKNMDLKSIREISYDIRPSSDELPKECPLQTTPYTGRHFAQTVYQWKASALCTKAAYFEDVQLERYGHSVCPTLEPVISGARFFLTVPFLPYKMGLITPDECVYTLGHYRAGSCAPYMLDPLPISVRAILFEGAAVAGAVVLLP
ncbi:MAG: hypothetical protein FWE67_11860 [Planctomycetaceae bacterium]|nr:hypothetical protein [Planctomycetaceae bacterium]